MTADPLATPWGLQPLADIDVPAAAPEHGSDGVGPVVPGQRAADDGRPGDGPWAGHRLPVPAPSWLVAPQRRPVRPPAPPA